MNAFKANPFVYIFPALVLLGVIGYYVYGALDRMGLETTTVQARVTGKQFTPGAKTYSTNVAAGHAYVQSVRNPGAYVVTLDIEGQPTSAYVAKELYEQLDSSDTVRAQIRYTRFSRRLQVIDVSR